MPAIRKLRRLKGGKDFMGVRIGGNDRADKQQAIRARDHRPVVEVERYDLVPIVASRLPGGVEGGGSGVSLGFIC
jgi:hypothetical protein